MADAAPEKTFTIPIDIIEPAAAAAVVAAIAKKGVRASAYEVKAAELLTLIAQGKADPAVTPMITLPLALFTPARVAKMQQRLDAIPEDKRSNFVQRAVSRLALIRTELGV